MGDDGQPGDLDESVLADAEWTEPPWCGFIETTGDALLILEAARRGLIPRVTRRLVDNERKMIASGSVFVFDEDESGIKRWTDGYYWSPSRILGNFLLYREVEKRGTGRGKGNALVAAQNAQTTVFQSVEPQRQLTREEMDKHDRGLVGSLTNPSKFKAEGLMKKTFSLTIGGVSQHLISYYRIEDVEQGRLRTPSSLPELATLEISPEYLDKTHFRNPPRVEVGPDGRRKYVWVVIRYWRLVTNYYTYRHHRGDSEEAESSRGQSQTLLTAAPRDLPAQSPPDADSNSTPRGSQRFEPYPAPKRNASPASKRRRAMKGRGAAESQEPPRPQASTSAAPAVGSTPEYPHPPYAAQSHPHPVPHPYADPHYFHPGIPPPAFYPLVPAFAHMYPPPSYGVDPNVPAAPAGPGMSTSPHPSHAYAYPPLAYYHPPPPGSGPPAMYPYYGYAVPPVPGSPAAGATGTKPDEGTLESSSSPTGKPSSNGDRGTS